MLYTQVNGQRDLEKLPRGNGKKAESYYLLREVNNEKKKKKTGLNIRQVRVAKDEVGTEFPYA